MINQSTQNYDILVIILLYVLPATNANYYTPSVSCWITPYCPTDTARRVLCFTVNLQTSGYFRTNRYIITAKYIIGEITTCIRVYTPGYLSKGRQVRAEGRALYTT